ncbi:MAG: serine hydrolase [Candidatus Coatesbacteria bacterium]|nr:serine hydrolase [Candidatus Coatesbacteria bacterium]
MSPRKKNPLAYLLPVVALTVTLLGVLGAEDPGPLLTTAKPADVGMDPERLDRVDGLIEELIDAGRMPGAVLLVARRGAIVKRAAYGWAELEPERRPMAPDTLFDLASLTKVVATSTAVMMLVERGEFRLDQPVSYYLPAFAEKGKADITIRQLLTHQSGLPAWRDFSKTATDSDSVVDEICAIEPKYAPGVRYLYSDLNMIILGELIRRIDGRTLDEFCSAEIFAPLGMRRTGFNPAPELAATAAATTESAERPEVPEGTMLVGRVHDENAALMGGIAGHAGLFSTADDLAVFAQMMLSGGVYGETRLLSPVTVETMTAQHLQVNSTVRRGLGWDLHSSEYCTAGDLLSLESYGHTGFTGTSLWIDPAHELVIILLTNRVHPDGRSRAFNEVRARVHNVVAASIVD